MEKMMKFKFDRKYTQIAVYAVIVIVVSGFLLMSAQVLPGLAEMADIFTAAATPIIWGIVIGYLMNPAVDFFRFKVFGKWSKKSKSRKTDNVIRNLSIFIVAVLALGIITGLVVLIVPQVVKSLSGIADNFNTYANNFLDWATVTFADIPQIAEILADPISRIESFINSSWQDISVHVVAFGTKVGGGLLSFLLGFKDFIIGFIIAIYFVSSKEMIKAQAKKITFALFKNSHAQSIISVSKRINDIFIHYITGILLDAFFVGCATFVGATIIGTPYPLLMAVLIACTNVIPFFGPFIGGIPACFLTLLVDPMKAVWFAIFMVAMQQFDGNIMVPLIQGDRIGVPSVWVLVGIIIGGGLFGFAGMLLAVPVLAIIYMLSKEFIAGKLKKKNLPVEGVIYERDIEKYVDGYEYTEEEKASDKEWIESLSEKSEKKVFRFRKRNGEEEEKQSEKKDK
ncbi:MAG: AI-2E family transporter [Ruminiclostridium sp.]